ncbi:hypothetical protein V5O48_008518 [Marasmius crinis-equi]|uniref:BTB domain-containing protein n=1 Tax=Marasmius crinis-equi TaxID=585013 RepID=A0ABR3FDN8_9AGAR
MSPNDPITSSERDPNATIVVDEQECKHAKAPFDDPNNADSVVETSDNIQFNVYRIIPSLVSSYFKDMFNSPLQPAQVSKLGLNDPEDAENDVYSIPRNPVHRIAEDSKVFDTILRWIYPGLTTPTLSTIDELSPILEAMVKYRMENTAPFRTVISSLLNLAKPTPGQAHPDTIRVFAIFHKLRTSIPQASLALIKRRCLSIPLNHFATGWCPELEHIPALALFELMQFHTLCSNSIRTHVPSFNEWREGCPALRYKCSTKTGAVERLPMKLPDVKDMYHYLLNRKYEHSPYAGVTSISAAIMLEKKKKCSSCDHPCSALNKALGRIISDEILAAVKGVEEGKEKVAS